MTALTPPERQMVNAVIADDRLCRPMLDRLIGLGLRVDADPAELTVDEVRQVIGQVLDEVGVCEAPVH